MFGHQLASATETILRLARPVDAGPANRHQNRQALVALVMQVVVSLAVLAFAVITLIGDSSETAEKAVWGAVGVVIGYWLR